MRVDTAGPRTWLLAGAAGWALAAWLLALAGMGSAIATLDGDTELAKPLPTLRATTSNRIGPLAQYSEIGQRPLFSTDRRPRQFYLQGSGEDAAKAFDYVLTSVLITPQVKLAILQSPDGSQSLRVKLGEAPEPQPAWRLSALNERSAVFDGPEGQRTLELRVFDGQGGAAPTAAAGGGDAGRRPAVTSTASADEKPGPQGPAEVDPAPVAAAKPTPPKPATATPAPAPEATAEAQMEAIRKRIQARREQLRRESQQKQPPAQSP